MSPFLIPYFLPTIYNAGAEPLRGLFSPADNDVPIYLDDVQCIGTELSIDDCVSDTSTEDCTHLLDAGVQCQPAE